MKEDSTVKREEVEKPRDISKRKKKNNGIINSDENIKSDDNPQQLFKVEPVVNPIETLIYTVVLAILVGAFFQFEEYRIAVGLIIVIIVLIYIITYQNKKLLRCKQIMKINNIIII